MFTYNNLYELLISVLVALIYAFLVYVTSPVRTISFKMGLKYIIMGCLSVGILSIFYRIFPAWDQLLPVKSAFFNPILILCFVQIAFAEEISKFISFKIADAVLNNTHNQHPNAFVFYAGMNALGFAVIENAAYLSRYGSEIIGIRAVTATLLHLLTGIIIGYFMALGRLSKQRSRSVLDLFLKSRAKLKTRIYTTLGILSAMFLHGMYNYNLMVSDNYRFSIVITFMILLLSVVIMGILVNDLEKNYLRNRIGEK